VNWWHYTKMYKNKPKPETNQEILARIKKEMDEPRMAESAREEDVKQTTRQKLEEVRNPAVDKAFTTEKQPGIF
jgi:hypothetical protein